MGRRVARVAALGRHPQHGRQHTGKCLNALLGGIFVVGVGSYFDQHGPWT